MKPIFVAFRSQWTPEPVWIDVRSIRAFGTGTSQANTTWIAVAGVPEDIVVAENPLTVLSILAPYIGVENGEDKARPAVPGRGCRCGAVVGDDPATAGTVPGVAGEGEAGVVERAVAAVENIIYTDEETLQ